MRVLRGAWLLSHDSWELVSISQLNHHIYTKCIGFREG